MILQRKTKGIGDKYRRLGYLIYLSELPLRSSGYMDPSATQATSLLASPKKKTVPVYLHTEHVQLGE